MILHKDISKKELWHKIRKKEVQFAGNRKLKIYGTLSCCSGKRMMQTNRVFFQDENEAIASGFRPCGHCMRTAYEKWKKRRQNSILGEIN